MRIFITGATGLIGSAVAQAAVAAGHAVHGLAHTPATAQLLAQRSISPVAGDLADTRSLRAAVTTMDAVIHAGFAGGDDAAAIDRRAAEALASALARSDRPFIYTSGVWVLGETGDAVADEESPTAPIELVAWRAPLEQWLRDAVALGTHAIVLRPGVVRAPGAGIPARVADGSLPLVGDGEQRWPVVHVDDLARLYLAALVRARPGSVLHGVAEVARAVDVVTAESGALSSTRRMDLATARRLLGPFADALALDQVVSAERTRAATSWVPLHRLATAPLAATAT
jgi:nucleoside-diphosphate-sugar epimerase